MFVYAMSIGYRVYGGSTNRRLGLRWFVIVLFCLLVIPPGLAAADGTRRHFEARHLFFLQTASDPQNSPDGRHVDHVRRAADIMSDSIRFNL